MSREDRLETDSSKVASIIGKSFVGSYIIIAETFEPEGPPKLSVHVSPGTSGHLELGLLKSALIRAEEGERLSWVSCDDPDCDHCNDPGSD